VELVKRVCWRVAEIRDLPGILDAGGKAQLQQYLRPTPLMAGKRALRKPEESCVG